MMKRNRVVLLVIIAITVLNGCESHRQNNDWTESGGLGMSRGQWDRNHGKARWEDDGQVQYVDQQGSYFVWFGEGNARAIDFRYDLGKYPALDAARDQSRTLLPFDSKFLRTETVDGWIVDHYSSESLKVRFVDQDYWRNAMPGPFQILYRVEGHTIENFIVGPG